MAEQEEEKAGSQLFSELAENESESSPADGVGRRGGDDAEKGIKKEKKKEGGVGERAEKEAVSYESRTAGRRIKISVNKRLRWRT